MTQFTLPTKIDNVKKDTIETSFDSAKDVTCNLVSGSLTIKIVPEAQEIINNVIVKKDTFQLNSKSTTKSFSKINKITITGDDAMNTYNLFS